MRFRWMRGVGGWLVWVVLRLVWKLTVSSPSRHSVPTLW